MGLKVDATASILEWIWARHICKAPMSVSSHLRSSKSHSVLNQDSQIWIACEDDEVAGHNVYDLSKLVGMQVELQVLLVLFAIFFFFFFFFSASLKILRASSF